MKVRRNIGLVVFLTLVSSPMWAAEVSVDCDAGQSIGGALATLPRGDFNKITISGTCRGGPFFVVGFDNLTLEGTAGATLEPGNAVPSPFTIVFIANSGGVTIRNLRFRGTAPTEGSVGVFLSNGIATIDKCLVEDFATPALAGAIFVTGNSLLTIRETTIQNNRLGIHAVSGSTVSIGGFPLEQTPTVIKGNFWGLFIQEDAAANLLGLATITNNQVGVVVGGGSIEGAVFGQIRIAENQIGIAASGGHVELFGFDGPGATLERNTTVGLFLDGAYAFIGQGSVIQENGSFAPSGRGGILATNNARLDILPGNELPRPRINNNNGAGIILTDGSSARILGAEINGNAGDGVRVVNQSVVRVEGNTILGNGGSALFCDKHSLGSGELANVGKVSCKKFEKSLEPALRIPFPTIP